MYRLTTWTRFESFPSAIRVGFIQDFLVGVGKMMHTEPHPSSGVWGYTTPRNYSCSEVAYGGLWAPKKC